MAEVTIYTRELCGYCARAMQLLKRKGVEFEQRDATYSPELRNEMIQRANGSSTFPQIFINGKHIGGCDDLYVLERAGELDPLLAR